MEAPPRTAETRKDDGFALLTVLGSMVVVTLFLLSSLAYALNSTGPSRADQDAKAALAAAQAGVQEFASRLAFDDTYYADNGGAYSANPASSREVSVLGSGGAAASYTYRLLTDANTTGINGVVRLAVTGCSTPKPVTASPANPTPCKDAGGVRRDLIAEFRPEGFLKYIYFTDLENGDPSLFPEWKIAEGTATNFDDWIAGPGNNQGTQITWEASPALLQSACTRYYYAGRHQPQYVAGAYVEVKQPMRYNNQSKLWVNDGAATRTPKAASTTTPVFLTCQEISFTSDDLVKGPAHSNDSMQIIGGVNFAETVTSAWPSTPPVLDAGRTFLPPPADGKLWWGNKTLTLPAKSPAQAKAIPLPLNNLELKDETDPTDPTALGCIYTGQTSIRFAGTSMFVRSPASTATTNTPSRCYDTANPGVEQRIDTIPPVIYVQNGTCGTDTFVGFPVSGESTEAWLPTVKYGCGRGHAFVSGVLSGRVTVGTEQDIVITGDTTYQNGTTGTDTLGLIPQGSAWVYHPVTDVPTNTSCTPQPDCRFVNTTGVTPVRRIDAALLSVQRSFLAQNWYMGAPLSTEGPESGCAEANLATLTCSKLTVRGSIVQKHRGAVGATASATRPRAGYLKNYIYDKRLLNSPPPFFLQPSDAWRLARVSD